MHPVRPGGSMRIRRGVPGRVRRRASRWHRVRSACRRSSPGRGSNLRMGRPCGNPASHLRVGGPSGSSGQPARWCVRRRMVYRMVFLVSMVWESLRERIGLPPEPPGVSRGVDSGSTQPTALRRAWAGHADRRRLAGDGHASRATSAPVAPAIRPAVGRCRRPHAWACPPAPIYSAAAGGEPFVRGLLLTDWRAAMERL